MHAPAGKDAEDAWKATGLVIQPLDPTYTTVAFSLGGRSETCAKRTEKTMDAGDKLQKQMYDAFFTDLTSRYENFEGETTFADMKLKAFRDIQC